MTTVGFLLVSLMTLTSSDVELAADGSGAWLHLTCAKRFWRLQVVRADPGESHG
jgi:hypothetical protein